MPSVDMLGERFTSDKRKPKLKFGLYENGVADSIDRFKTSSPAAWELVLSLESLASPGVHIENLGETTQIWEYMFPIKIAID